MITIIAAGIIYFFGLSYFVFLIGQHSFDQLFLGAQYGLWMALYLHFAWRDTVQDHISYVVQAPSLSKEKCGQYIATSAAVWGAFVATIYAEVIYLRATMDLPQAWMAILNTCGIKFPVDPETGLFLPGGDAFIMPEAQKIGVAFFAWGTYVGIVLFRLFGQGRSPFNHYNGHLIQKLIFVVINYTLYKSAFIGQDMTKKSGLFAQILFARMIPTTLCGVFATCIVPALSSRFTGYPVRILDEKYQEGVDDDKYVSEQPNLLKENELRLNGKSNCNH